MGKYCIVLVVVLSVLEIRFPNGSAVITKYAGRNSVTTFHFGLSSYGKVSLLRPDVVKPKSYGVQDISLVMFRKEQNRF